MATNDTSSRVIIDVLLNSEDAAKRAADLATSIKNIRTEQEGLKKSGETASAAYAQNAQMLRTLQQEQKAYITISQNAKGSNNELRAQLALLTNSYNALGKEERDGTNAGKSLQTQIRAISDELKKNESAVGDNRRNVGNYADALGQAGQSQQTFATTVSNSVKGFGFFPSAVTDAGNALTNFVKTQRNVIAGFQSLETIQAKAIAATEADIVAQDALAAAEERVAASEAEITTLRQAEEATAAELVAANQALLAASIELNVAQEAQIATQAELATAQELLANKTGASNSIISSSFTSTGAVIGAVLVAAGYAVFSFLKQYDSFTDGLEADTARFKAGFTQIGSAIKSVFTDFDFSGFGKIGEQADKAAKAVERFQDLQDRTDVNEQQNQEVQNQVALYRLQARNRSLDNDQRQAYLDKADKLERDQADKTKKLHADIINETVDFANKRNSLSNSDIKELQNGNLARANVLLNDDKITTEAYQKLKEAYTKRNSDQQQANAALEKIQNDQDKYAQQAEQKAKARSEAEKKRQQEDLKAQEELAKSKLATASGILTSRQKELEDINLDINKRVDTYRKYGQVTTQLELERLSRIQQLNQKFQQEDLKQIQANVDEAANLRIANISDPLEKEKAQQEQSNKLALRAIDNQIMAVAARAALGEQGLTDLLDSYLAVRNQKTEDNALKLEQIQTKINQRKFDLEQANDAAALQQQADAINLEQQQNDARLAINDELASSYGSLAGTISDFAGKSTTLGRLAFVAQQAFAIAEILINGEREQAAISAKYALLELNAAAIPFVGPFLVAGLEAAKYAELTVAGVKEGVSIAKVAAATVTGIISGKAQGGIQGIEYNSDGKGHIFPGYAKHDTINARLAQGETVITAGAAQNPYDLAILNFINQKHGGRSLISGYKGGGYALGGTYAGSSVQKSANDTSASLAAATLINQAIAKLNLQVAVTDINTAQANYARVQERATF